VTPKLAGAAAHSGTWFSNQMICSTFGCGGMFDMTDSAFCGDAARNWGWSDKEI